ncbi:MAG: lactate utilization protein [Nitrososphaerota archaeon]|nr:lactate utilization protein [Nitrososphaerota archaeon]
MTIEAIQGTGKRWDELADQAAVDRTVAALKSRGFEAEVVRDGGSALEAVKKIIPAGARVMTSGTTQEQIGLMDILKSEGSPWVNLKGEILAEKDRDRQVELRHAAIYAQYFVGSVQAVTEEGELITGSATGSQLAAYAYGAENVILVVGTQKVARNLEEGLRRLREHSTPMEDRRMKGVGAPGTVLSKTLIIERQTRPKVHVILVNESLGF